MTLCNAYLIKGYLLDKQAPAEVSAAIDAVIASLRDAEAPREAISGPAQSTLPFTAPQPEDEPSAEAPARKKREWTPEQREAAAQRMRDRIASGVIRKRGADAPGEEPALSWFPTDGAN